MPPRPLRLWERLPDVADVRPVLRPDRRHLGCPYVPVAARPGRHGDPPTAPREGPAAGRAADRRADHAPLAPPQSGLRGRLPLPHRPRAAGPADDPRQVGCARRGDDRTADLPAVPHRRRIRHPRLARHVRAVCLPRRTARRRLTFTAW
ncbi:hypothetical protein SBRY_30141 [Actinacidiphila bryophytorum]|uniref:Uncharacterized protein n=1 Tax=Actinacidiphila bryophytorum TaxID=1436133 RepID=A0A9W4MG66_9ACTN|nr:hypothetical protein SBRY_30141 [Actinacidiphila bryophytorum]